MSKKRTFQTNFTCNFAPTVGCSRQGFGFGTYRVAPYTHWLVARCYCSILDFEQEVRTDSLRARERACADSAQALFVAIGVMGTDRGCLGHLMVKRVSKGLLRVIKGN